MEMIHIKSFVQNDVTTFGGWSSLLKVAV